ncbi:hypothetical protein EJ110_NYTH18653 [Nymphaea thermarum]|nr:hypothetical protein EJ110_NYTH18653 [Nymphaea thermarum]
MSVIVHVKTCSNTQVKQLASHRYDLSKVNTWGARRITTAEELFNHRHSLLRTIVERAFGLLKGHFPILKAQV